MALHKHAPAPVARYITVQDAIDRIGVTERTLRRWIEEAEDQTIDESKKKLHDVMRDPSGFVRLNLDEVERIVQARGGVAPSLHQRLDGLLERVETLEAQAQKVVVLEKQVEGLQFVLAHVQGTTEEGQAMPLADVLAYLPLRRRASNTQEPVAKRGLPPGTMRLVNFAEVHQVKIWDLKQLSIAGEIELEIYQREEGARRNKQEWWITPAQHRQIAEYCQQHDIAYTPCPECVTQIQEEQKTTIAIGE